MGERVRGWLRWAGFMAPPRLPSVFESPSVKDDHRRELLPPHGDEGIPLVDTAGVLGGRRADDHGFPPKRLSEFPPEGYELLTIKQVVDALTDYRIMDAYAIKEEEGPVSVYLELDGAELPVMRLRIIGGLWELTFR